MFSLSEVPVHDQKQSDPARDLLLDLGQVESDLALRRLLWEYLLEWEALSAEWIATPFKLLNVDQLQKHVKRFTHTINILEKGIELNFAFSDFHYVNLILFDGFQIFDNFFMGKVISGIVPNSD